MMVRSLWMISVLGMLVGCNEVQPQVVTVIKEVKVPVKCKVPEVKCSFNGPGWVPVIEMRECIIAQEKAMKVCK